MRTRMNANSTLTAILLALPLLMLTACDTGQTERQPETSIERMIEPQLDALEKAENVEDSLQDAVKEREEAMRENGT